MSGRFYDQRGGGGGGYHRQGGGSGGRGRGFGGPRGRGGRGRGRGGLLPDRQQLMQVQLNMYRLTMNDESRFHSDEWFQYAVEIRDAKKTRKKGPDGEFIKGSDGKLEFVIVPFERRGEEKILDTNMGDNPLSRKILQKLQQDLWKDGEKLIVTDGHKTAYSTKRLFETSDEMQIEDSSTNEKPKRPQSVYGPADGGTPLEHPQAQQTAPYKTFYVRIKKDCEEEDSYADNVRPSWYFIRLTEVGVIPNQLVGQVMENRISDYKQIEILRQLVDTVIKSAMSSTLIAEGRSPHLFYLPEDFQDASVLGNALMNKFRGESYSPFVGLAQTAKFCQNGNVFLSCDAGLGWFDKESVNEKSIPILDEMKNTIAGVRIPSVHEPIMDDRKKADIEKSLKKLRIRMECGPPSKEWEEEQVERGRSEDWLKKRRFQSRPPTRMDCKPGKVSIIWCACEHYFNELPPRRPRNENQDLESAKKGEHGERDAHNAETQDGGGPEKMQEQGARINICDYWLQKKGITIKYPNMPIVLIKTKAKIDEYFPIEFLYQSFGKKKLVGADDHKDEVLGWNDRFAASDRIELTTKLKEIASEMKDKSSMTLPQLLRQFLNFTSAREPVTVNAKVLPEPTLTFGNNKRTFLKNGSWNLRGVKFSSPSDMSSFVVVDFVGGSACETVVENLLNVMNGHGMQTPSIFNERQRMLQNITVRAKSERPSDYYETFRNAIETARQFYLHDKQGIFCAHKTWFKTKVSNPNNGETVDCLFVFHNRQRVMILPEEENFETHRLVYKDGASCDARLKAVVDGNRNGTYDLFDIRKHQDGYDVKNGEKWVQKIEFVWQLKTGEIHTENDFEKSLPFFPKEKLEELEEHIECPAMLIIYLPDDSKDRYSLVKMMCQFYFGVQSQCITHKKYISQRNMNKQDDYCSNVALKMNTKLFSLGNQGCAWDISCSRQISRNIPWVSEIPTLVFGIAMSHEQPISIAGVKEQPISIVGASACLDPSCMAMAQTVRVQLKLKSDLINDSVMLSITKSLATQFCLHNGNQKPRRVIVFRDGASDGSFDKILEHETAAIRKAFYELNLTEAGFKCPNASQCQGRGCVFCTPIITHVISQTQHNIRVTLPKREGFKTNVLSGTCVDDELVMPFQNGLKLATKDVTKDGPENAGVHLFSDMKDNGYDFLLTPQGGLKGTSKPVFYRVLLNENAVWRPKGEGASPLTKDLLQECVFYMSHMYGTATKSVRKVPVVHYSKRLTETFGCFKNYILGDKLIDLQDPVDKSIRYIRKYDDNLIDEKMAPEISSELLSAFGPYDPKSHSDLVWRVPFRPHISA